MKTTKTLISAMAYFIMALAIFANSVPAPSSVTPSVRNVAIVLSPFYAANDSEKVKRSLLDFLLTAPAGTQVIPLNGDTLKRITSSTIVVPVLKYDSPANRQREMAKGLGEVLTWFKQTNAGPAEFKGTAAIDILGAIDQLAQTTESPLEGIAFLGNPIFRAGKEPQFSMMVSNVPSDANLNADAEASIYSVRGKENRLKNCLIHFCYLNEDGWTSSNHKDKTLRWWALWFAGQGATLATMSPDLNGFFKRTVTPSLPPIGKYEPNPRDTKLEMRPVPPRNIPLWLPPVAPATNAPTVEVAPIPEMQGKTGIGIIWDCPADLDLHVIPKPGAAELYFGAKTSSEGKYLHDYTSANATSDYEAVELTGPVRIQDVEVWVNYYSGSTPQPHGTVCVFHDGRRYVGAFTIAASEGDRAAGRSRRATDTHWVRVDIKSIVASAR